MKTSTRFIIIGLVAGAIIVLAIIGGRSSSSQPESSQAASSCRGSHTDDAAAYMNRFTDGMDVAMAAPKLVLASSIQNLQTIHREFQREDWPECFTDVTRYADKGMGLIIDGFVAFLSGKSDYESAQLFEDGAAAISHAHRNLDRLFSNN